ncbi:fumarylacetoacetase [Streptomyces sp. NPDC048275]|uniref:fumarylacetoacetase n=1 Tax=Streptomyces sp. NPDC048275 TaxID=3155629 RepID=UPI0033D5DABE
MAQTWVDIPENSPFPLQNLPYGIFSPSGSGPRVGVAVGNHVLDLAQATGDTRFVQPTLNTFLAAGRRRWSRTRAQITSLLTDERHRARVEGALHPMAEVTLHLPVAVGDYVDFYASEHHAAGLGRMFRPGQEPLLPNWKHLPVGYHGRAGTIVPTGTPVVRPHGQRILDGTVVHGPTTRLDIEAEVGFVIGPSSRLGTPVPAKDFAEHVFGVVLVNDWSARDIQAWEYVPLGPFLGKSFATSVSAWVVPLEALGAARVPTPTQDPVPLPYLLESEPWGLDLDLEVEVNGTVVSRPPYREMYWSPAQMLAHMTAGGASVRTGDLYASGTVSGPATGQAGSLIELTENGAHPLELADGRRRVFLEDGDTVTLRATAPGADGARIGFGPVSGTVVATPKDACPRL